MKVLYVCPYAHYSGHHPHAATVEPTSLVQSGVDVTLLTFCGITNNPKLGVPHFTVVRSNKWFEELRSHTLLRWFLMLVETLLTLRRAASLKYDVIHLRDGEPFLFAAPLVSLFYRNLRWCISLTASVLVAPRSYNIMQSPFLAFYTLVMNTFINNPLWRLVYRVSLRRNKFVFTPQNEVAKRGYDEYMNGVFGGHVVCIPCYVDGSHTQLSRSEARAYLGLPQDKLILLSFGATHPGKDFRCVMEALRQLPNVLLVHAGTWSFSLGGDPKGLAREYGVEDKVWVFNYYVPEEEKSYFFCAADAAILSYTKLFMSTSSMLWDAARHSLPVISSDANTLGSDVRKYDVGLLFEAENAESLAEAVKQFEETNLEVLSSFKHNCVRFVEDFSEEKWTERYKDVYERLMKEVV